MHIYIYSTLAADMRYVNHLQGGADLPVQDGEGVLIKGGTGVADRHMFTPRGVVTEITPEQLAYIQQNPVFLLHKKNGFVAVEESRKDVERVVSEGMQPGDESRQLTPEDFGTGQPGDDAAAHAATDKPDAKDNAKGGKRHK